MYYKANEVSKMIDRRTFIGGSDMGIILGLSSYKTAYELYLEKIAEQEIVHEETQYQYWGKRLEHIVREEYEKRNDCVVTLKDTLTHPQYDFIRAHVDGFVDDKNCVLEVKCSSSFMTQHWGEEGTDEIPLTYKAQVALYCAVTEADYADIAVLIGGHEYRQYRYTREYDFEKVVIDAAVAFWKRVVERSAPNPSCLDDLKLMYSKSEAKAIESTYDINQCIIELKELSTQSKAIKEKEEQLKMTVFAHMKDADTLKSEENVIATWKSTKTGARRFTIKD